MKKIKYILPIASIALVGFSPLTTLSSCQNRKKVFPEIYRCEQLTPTLYCLDQNKTTGVIFYDDWGSNNFPIYLINNSHVAYVEVKSYINLMFEGKGVYSITTNDGITTITNDIAQGLPYDQNATCVIDFEKQTITFNHYDAWRNHYWFNLGPLLEGCNGAYTYFSKVSLDKYVYGGPLVIDLKKYNMVGYYTEENHSFLPLELITNIFCVEYNPLHWNGNGLYQRITGNVDLVVPVQKYVREHAAEGFYNEEYMQYCYDLLALTLDFHYGLRERASRVTPGTTVKYLPDGAYSILKNYHDRLVSTQDDVCNEAYLEVFRTLLDDGGHTYYGGLNALSTKTFETSKSIGSESSYINKAYANMTETRSKASGNVSPQNYWLKEKGKEQEWIDNWAVDSYYKEYETDKGKVAYITFDSFWGSVLDYSEEEYQEQKESFFPTRALQKYTTEENSVHSTIRMTLWADKQIKENNIKNVVIDLSCNGGGEVYAEHFIASWLCGSVREKIYNPVSKSYTEYTVYADIDNDGKFDSKDYLPSDVNLYVITSPFSFSCANLLACNIQDNRPKNTYFIGAPAGGGACFVQGELTTGLNNEYQISSTWHMLRKDSTYKNKISVDSGNSISEGWAIDPDTQTSDYFDRDKLNKRILG